MPWNTAKTDVDEDHEVWAPVRKEMVDALRAAQTVMNRRKTERERNPEDERPITQALASAKPTPGEVAPSRKLEVPKPGEAINAVG